MKILVSKQGNFLHIKEPQKVKSFQDCEYVIEINNEKKRTSSQNNSIHLYCKLIADELNNAGYQRKCPLNRFLSQKSGSEIDIKISWTAEAIKNEMWRPVMEAIAGKESTTELNTNEVTEIYEELNAYLSEKGISVPFPSEERK